ncbi:MAG: serine/threonine-protein phosphatase [Chloroflexi bacterium]|nr:serine/threonine-protein phosphatase [Chloroflexota bacterium]
MTSLWQRLLGRSRPSAPAVPGPAVPASVEDPARRRSPAGGGADEAAVPPPAAGSLATIPIQHTAPHPAPEPVHSTQIRFAISYDVGRVRPHNEDTLFVFTSNLIGDESLPGFGLFIVADGMGGYLLGERASGTAIRAMAGMTLESVYLPLLRGNPPERADLQRSLEAAVHAANRAVNEEVPGSGTTLTAALVLGHRVSLAHVGDSRAYLVEKDGLQPITRDHSLVQRLIELGQITREEAATHAHRNVLIRAVGQDGELEVDIGTTPLAGGSRLLLCSDGLWGSLVTGWRWPPIRPGGWITSPPYW